MRIPQINGKWSSYSKQTYAVVNCSELLFPYLVARTIRVLRVLRLTRPCQVITVSCYSQSNTMARLWPLANAIDMYILSPRLIM